MGSGDVVVVGAGVIGLATAWRLSRRGADVTLVDPQPARGASWAAAGMLAPVTEVSFSETDLLALNLSSARRFPDFVAALESDAGGTAGYRGTGTVVVARDTDDLAALERLGTFQSGLGLAVERLSSRALRRLEPGLAPTVRGGLLVDGDHQVDNRALLELLLAACARSGVALRTAAVERIDVGVGAVGGVELADGTRVPAGAVVLAAGWSSAGIGGLPEGLLPPLRPVKGQLLHLRTPAPLAERTIRGLDVYVVPRGDGRVVVGATMEERRDPAVTAGAVRELLTAAFELLPGIDEAELTETAVGLRPATPDNVPAIGATDVPGLFVAAGHHRNGVLLAPLTADAIADLVLGGSTAEPIACCAPQRFTAGHAVLRSGAPR